MEKLRLDVKCFSPVAIQRAWQKVNRQGPIPDQENPFYQGLSECWEWTASNDNRGYGQYCVFDESGKMRNFKAHRYLWMASFGPLEAGQQVLHKCDNPACVNPDHLFVGTRHDNMRDKEAKGRANHATGKRNGRHTKPGNWGVGENAPRAKYSDALIDYIRRRYAEGGISARELSSETGVSKTHIGYVVRGSSRKPSM